MYAALLLAVLQGVPAPGPSSDVGPDTVLVADPADLATAYADPATRELVRRARGHRGVIDDAVFHYTASARQRISVSVRALRRERLLYRRETATEVEWWRDRPGRVRVVGAREAVPLAVPGLRVPDDLTGWARELVPEPGDDRLFVTPTDGRFAWHPLVEGGESLYRYAIGDSTVISLPDGSRVRLVELQAIPRERDIRVVTGSFWIEMDSHAIVRALFRPARGFDLERDLAELDPGEEDELDDVPGFLKPITFDIDYITVDYGLWDMRWWMPRLLAFHGSLGMGPATFPVAFEILYADYTVEPDPMGLPALPPVIRHLAGDPSSTPRPYEMPIRVELADTATLLDSPALPDDFYAAGPSLIADRELADLTERLGELPAVPWAVTRPRVTAPWSLGRGLLRYNRVEALAVGVRVDWDPGPARVDATGRVATADGAVTGELGVEVPTLRRHWRVAAYRRLAEADPPARALGLGSSLNALLLGRDDGTFFRATGAEVRLRPPGGAGYSVRLYAERQRGVAVNTDWSLPHLFDETDTFRPNIRAAPADQVGLTVAIGGERGLDPAGFRWGGWLAVTAETGTYTFVRPGLTLRASAPVLG
ncbi:MAG: hypothetical protein ACOCUW_05105, partial [Gemmatimonadota bacterium]